MASLAEHHPTARVLVTQVHWRVPPRRVPWRSLFSSHSKPCSGPSGSSVTIPEGGLPTLVTGPWVSMFFAGPPGLWISPVSFLPSILPLSPNVSLAAPLTFTLTFPSHQNTLLIILHCQECRTYLRHIVFLSVALMPLSYLRGWVRCRPEPPAHLCGWFVRGVRSPGAGLCAPLTGAILGASGRVAILEKILFLFFENSETPEGLTCKFSSVAQSCLTLCDPMNRSTPCHPVHQKLPEFTQTLTHRVGDAIQPSHPLLSPSPPAPNPSQNQGLFQWVNSSHEVDKVLEFQRQHQSFQWTPRTDLLPPC